MKNNTEPYVQDMSLRIGIFDELVNVKFVQDDFVDLPDIQKVIYQGIDILGCLSPEMIDDIVYEVDVRRKKVYEMDKIEAQISQWESNEADKREYE